MKTAVPHPTPRREVDLYPAVKTFLEGEGFEVKGEVRGCDVVGVRGDEPPVIVELKLRFTLGLVLQALDRLRVSDNVYLAVPAETLYPHFLCIDFALCDDGEGRVEPKLIELAGSSITTPCRVKKSARRAPPIVTAIGDA